jgi:hypothetical protein
MSIPPASQDWRREPREDNDGHPRMTPKPTAVYRDPASKRARLPWAFHHFPNMTGAYLQMMGCRPWIAEILYENRELQLVMRAGSYYMHFAVPVPRQIQQMLFL